MPARIYITDMSPNQLVEGVFTVQNCQLGLTRAGKSYLKCLLADRTGRTPARMWNASEELIRSLPTDGFVELRGQTQPYQGEMQIIIHQIRCAHPSDDDLLELLPSTERDINEMYAEVGELLDSLENPSLRALGEAYREDRELMGRFRQAPAAMQLHHAYLGGLLEHTLGLMKLADAALPLYPRVSRDIVLMGLFLHDLGKCEELTWNAGFSYSDDGRLVGHIARGVIWLEEKARRCAEQGTPLGEDLVRVLQHIILSHHGVPEFGALKTPATPEAIFIHLLDNVDAKLNMALAARDAPGKPKELGGNFTEKVWALGTRIYRGDPLAEEAPAPVHNLSEEAPDEPERPRQEELTAQLKFGTESSGKGGL